jgi:hypothetical protein
MKLNLTKRKPLVQPVEVEGQTVVALVHPEMHHNDLWIRSR